MSVARTMVLALCASIAVPSSTSSAAPPTAAELVKERAAVAEKAYRTSLALYKAAQLTVDQVCAWSTRWLDAAIEVDPKAIKQALMDHLQRMTDLEAEVQKMFKQGLVNGLATDSIYYFRVEAQLWVTRGKR